jgi:hypothetical protein
MVKAREVGMKGADSWQVFEHDFHDDLFERVI